MRRNTVVLVTGATGMLGQSIVAEAHRRGLTPVGLARRNADLNVDISNEAALKNAIVAIRPALIVNTAAMTALDDCQKDPPLAYLINSRAVAVMVEACRTVKARLVHVSTDHYFSGDGDCLHNETAPVRLLNDYARTKFAAEAYALTDSTSLILRTNVTGWRKWSDRPTFFEWLVNSIEERRRLTLFNDFYTSTIDAPTFAVRLFDLSEQSATGLLNLASAETLSKGAFAVLTAGALGIPLVDPINTSIRSLGTFRAESLGLDVRRAQTLLGCSLPGAQCVIKTLLQTRP
jgi:dTDP-4-dehydrorhamnose reductase